LKQYGMMEGDLENICRATTVKNNPVNLSFESLLEIINRTLNGA
jgi:hypothetical protein